MKTSATCRCEQGHFFRRYVIYHQLDLSRRESWTRHRRIGFCYTATIVISTLMLSISLNIRSCKCPLVIRRLYHFATQGDATKTFCHSRSLRPHRHTKIRLKLHDSKRWRPYVVESILARYGLSCSQCCRV